ncbi:putative ribonuclease H-like domain-containing protein [Tanacetum coccineum]
MGGKEVLCNLKILYDAQREQLSDASVEIKAYTQGLKKVEAQLVAHQQGTGLHAPIIEEYESDSDDGAHDQGIKLTLADFQDFNGGPVALDGGCVCKGYIMVKEIKPEVFRQKLFLNDHTCVACQKGKQHKASCKAKLVSSISHTLQLLHMDLFGPTSVRSINHKTYCLVITDDFSRFSWTFFLRTKDETSAILKDFIRQIENQLNQKVKTIRCDNGTEFKNRDVIEFCGLKRDHEGLRNARTLQLNGVVEEKNMTLIEAARTMLADSFLPNTFWAEAVSYCLLYHLGKFARKSDEGFLVGYSLQSKAFRVYNLETKRVEENLHINFLENKPNVAGKGPTWLFDLDYLTDSMNYHSVRSENQANLHAGQQESNQNTGTKDKIDAGDSKKEDESDQDCFELPIWHSYSSTNSSASKSDNKRGGPREEEQVFLDDLARLQRQEKEANEEAEALLKNLEQETENLVTQAGAAKSSSTNIFSTVSTTAKASGTNLVNTVSIPVSTASPNKGLSLSDTTNSQEDDFEIPPLEDIHEDTTDGIFTHSSYDDEGAEADFINLETVVNVSPIPTSRINPSHPSALILGDPTSAVQTRSKVNKSSEAHAFVSYVQKQRRNNHKDFHHLISWRLHSSLGVHTLMTDEGLVVHMLIEKKYPLKKEILVQMLKLKLESEEESTMALELIRFIKKSWLVQDQTVLGKDYSNLLIADSLLKTIWFINAPCYDNEALASPNTNDEELSIPEQTATGKGTSNPLMAGSLPKTTKPT